MFFILSVFNWAIQESYTLGSLIKYFLLAAGNRINWKLLFHGIFTCTCSQEVIILSIYTLPNYISNHQMLLKCQQIGEILYIKIQPEVI